VTAPAAEGGPVLTVEEAAAYLRISRGLAFAAVRDGSLPCVRLGGRRILIPRGSSRRCSTATVPPA
jgi:excisionase family DNA binding protein